MDKLKKLLTKLIHSSAGRSRFVMAVLGLSVAMVLILAAVQIQVNYNDLLHSKNNQDSIANFLVVNKRLTDRNIGATSLSDAEINNLKQQAFVQSVGLLTPSRFKASIQSNSDRFPFYTDIAFESVPNEFIDVTSKDWHWEEGSQFVPVIVPNMFLDFYNFQFSFSQSLPQLTQQVVKMIIFKINLYGPGGITSFQGRVVGFSDRVSSLLIPQEFMDWANRNMSGGVQVKPSRVIIRTADPGNPALVEFLKKNGLGTDADKTRFSRYRQVVDLVVNISGITGFVLLLFALLVFTLFIQLTIASCSREIILLITLGAAPRQLERFLMSRFFPPNVWIIMGSILLLTVFQYITYKFLEKQHIFIHPWPSVYTILAAIVLLVVIGLVNRFSIRKHINKTGFE
jgi:hypothetical protein